MSSLHLFEVQIMMRNWRGSPGPVPITPGASRTRHSGRDQMRTTTFRSMQRFRGELIVKAHRLFNYHSTPGVRVTTKEKGQAAPYLVRDIP